MRVKPSRDSVRASHVHGDGEAPRGMGASHVERNGDGRYQAHLPAELHTHAETEDPERRRVAGADSERVLQIAAGVRVRDRRRGHELQLFGAQDDHSSSEPELDIGLAVTDRKSTRLNSSHRTISYAVFCLKK